MAKEAKKSIIELAEEKLLDESADSIKQLLVDIGTLQSNLEILEGIRADIEKGGDKALRAIKKYKKLRKRIEEVEDCDFI